MELSYPHPQTPPAGTLTTVAPGVHWLRMALPFALDHINLWLLEDGDEVVVVDTGFALDATREAWNQVLAERRISRIIVTHFHPDHLGLGAWLQKRDQAPLLMTQGEYTFAQLVQAQVDGYSVSAMLQLFRRHGLDDTRLEALAQRGNAYSKGVPELPATYRRLLDGNRIVIGGRSWQVITGYGHAPEHASLHCAELGVLISGDMLLPRITTNVSTWAATPEDDPLGLFLDSIGRYLTLPADTLVLPSHGLPFRGIATRVGQLEAHHAARCSDLLKACEERALSGAELIPTLFSRDISDPHQTMFAMGEVIAHLNHLVATGRLRRQESLGVARHQAV